MKKFSLILILIVSLILSICLDDFLQVLDINTIKTGDEVWVHFIDVGQGDSILIQSEFGNVLIDAGTKEMGQVVLSHLVNYGINRLDYVVATHPHSDHIGGLEQIIESIYIGQIIMPNVSHTSAIYKGLLEAIINNNINVIAPKSLDTFELGDVKFTVLAPVNDFYDNLNNYSVVLKMKYGESEFLFTGDIEGLSEHEILSENYDIDADVLKVAHHGSKTSSIPEFIERVKPAIAVISVGKNNSYNHPSEETLKTLYNFNAEILRTDEIGTIIIRTNGKDITY